MKSKFNTLFKHSFIYGIGEILTKISAILLLPLYTNYLTPEEYGILEIFYVTANLIQLFIALGIEHATLRFYFEYKEEKDQKAVISTSWIVSFILSISVLSILSIFSGDLSEYLFETRNYATYFIITFGVIVFSISQGISLAYVRAKNKSVLYIIFSLLGLIAKVIFNFLFIVHYGMKVQGVLLGNLIGLGLIWIFMTFYVFRQVGFAVHLSKMKEIYKYSYPLVFVGLGTVLTSTLDRFFLKIFVGLSAVGIYALAFKLGALIRFIFSEPFYKAYGPYRFEVMNDPDADKFYAKVLKYYLFGISFVYLGIVFFLDDIVKIMAKEDYWPALPYIPFVALVIVIMSLYYHFQIGIYIKKTTKILWKIMLVSVIVEIELNLILIPIFHIWGLIFSLLVSALILNGFTLHFSQKVFFVPYEWKNIIKLIVIISSLVFFERIFPQTNWKFAVDGVFILLFPIIMYFIKFFTPEEVNKIKSVFQSFAILGQRS